MASPGHGQAPSILGPEAPKAATPPQIPAEKDPVTLRQRARDERLQDEAKTRASVQEQKLAQKVAEKAQEEARQARPMYGFAEVSLLQPKAFVSAGRSNYSPEITSHVSAYVRTSWKLGAESIQPWLGFRVAPFGGYGTQDKLTARFAHTWFGPCIGFGAIRAAHDTDAHWPIRYGYLWSAGIAAVSRMVAEGDAMKNPPMDFSPTAWSADAPGIWSELRMIRISMGAVGLGLMAGLQTGRGKVFIYGGLTAAGFY